MPHIFTGNFSSINNSSKGMTLWQSILSCTIRTKGENYWNGGIRNLAKGNTEIVAEFIQKTVGGDLFEVETVKSCAEDYHVCTDETKKELRGHAHPELKW